MYQTGQRVRHRCESVSRVVLQAEGRAPLAPIVQPSANVQQEAPARCAMEKRARKSLSTQLEESSSQAAQSRKRTTQVPPHLPLMRHHLQSSGKRP